MIDKEKKYSISEVSKITGYETHVLRYYESDFKLHIPRTESRRRYYTYKEIEQIMYIKELQEKGLTNVQIKLVLDSPEILVGKSNEIAVTSCEDSMPIQVFEKDQEELIQTVCHEITSNIHLKLEETKQELIDYMDGMFEENDKEEDNEATNKEKDVLICENAKLKMKLKEKSYEMAELRERVNRLTHKEGHFWKRIFKTKELSK